MSDLQIIHDLVAGVARRRRARRALAGFAQGLLAGSLLLLLAVAVYLLIWVPAWLVPGAALSGGLLALGGLLQGGWKRATPLETARWIDEQQKLRERLSTALEIHDAGRQKAGEWEALLLLDAARHARGIRACDLVPFRFPPAAGWAALVLALSGTLAFIPALRPQALRQRAEETARLQQTGRELAAVARRELTRQPPALPPTEKSLRQTAELGEQLSQASLTRAQALQQVTRVMDQVASQQRALQQNPVPSSLARAARTPEGSPGPTSPDALQKRLDELQKELGTAANPPGKLDALEKSLQQARQQAASLPAPGTPGQEAARARMAQSLAELARQAASAGASLEALQSALQALAAGRTDRLLDDLEAATQDLEKLRQMAMALQQLQTQAAELGRNLAEQLQKGQAQAAAHTLKQMMEQLRRDNLTREQRDQICRELVQSLAAAKEYGKVADLLKKAAAQCQQDNRSGATESLAAARAELQQLLDQMADAQCLNNALDALARAEQAIRSGQSWSQTQASRPCGACQSQGCADCDGRGVGGKGGRRMSGGVGNWADEWGWTYLDETVGTPADNAGLQRPALEPRGVTDRPATLNPNLTPDQVKGRFSPGGSMPAITLKGVSIRGNSSVRFEEAAATAQQEAQNALNQDQVPRAYQQSVRDYFDDLRK